MGYQPTIENTLVQATLKRLEFDPVEEEVTAVGETPVCELRINLYELRKHEASHLLAQVFTADDLERIEAFERRHLSGLA